MRGIDGGWLPRIRRDSGLPDEFGLRGGARVRAIDRRIRVLRIVGGVLRWGALPGWGALSVVQARGVLHLGTLWSFQGLGVAACLLGTGAMLLGMVRKLRREMTTLEAERFSLSDDPPRWGG